MARVKKRWNVGAVTRGEIGKWRRMRGKSDHRGRKRIEELGSTGRQWNSEEACRDNSDPILRYTGRFTIGGFDGGQRTTFCLRCLSKGRSRSSDLVSVVLIPGPLLSMSPFSKTLYRVVRIFRFRSLAPIPNGSCRQIKYNSQAPFVPKTFDKGIHRRATAFGVVNARLNRRIRWKDGWLVDWLVGWSRLGIQRRKRRYGGNV